MKLSINWLNEYIDFNKSVEEISETLTMVGNEVESVETSGDIPGVIVAEIQEISAHPNADKLQLAKVFDGTLFYNVVCGAPNIKSGQKIFLATIGTKLPNDSDNSFFEIKKSKIRGELSEGMICSEKELGISDNHDGIMVLPKECILGESIKTYYSETVLDIDVTPNRVDCLSVIGLARDLSAKFSSKLKFDYSINHDINKNNQIVEIRDPILCPRYTGVTIDSVTITESPEWLKQRLISIGERPINNVVDITNYVMFEMGQPLHAFDLDKIPGGKIIVRESMEKEKIKTLDGMERELPKKSIVISDEKENPIGLAGIMGGGNSEIESSTKTVFLESGNWNPSFIRNTSKSLGLSTEASIRFERNLNPDLAIYGLSRAIDLILEIAGGKIRHGIEDNFPGKREFTEKIILNIENLKKHLGLEIENDQISETLLNLNFKFDFFEENGTWEITKPFWRSDIEIPEDIHEEIARIIGYDAIPLSYLAGSVPKWEPNKSLDTKTMAQDILVGAGLNETISYSALSNKLFSFTPKIFNVGDNIKLKNPISNEYSILRKSLIPSLVSTASRNSNNWKGPIKLFEIGNVFYELNSNIIEKTMIAGIITGPRQEISLNSDNSLVNYFDIKGVVELLARKLSFEFEPTIYEDNIFSKNRSSLIYNKNINDSLGYMGELSKQTLNENNFSTSKAVVFEIDLDMIIKSQKTFTYRDFSQYPQAHRDLSLIIDKSINFSEIEQIIYSENLVDECLIFDIYEGEEIPKNKISISLRINYQSLYETLSSKRLDKIETNILSKLEKKLGIYIREQ